MTATEIQRFVERMLALVEAERRAEVDEASRLLATLPAAELERRGVSVLRLTVAGETSGLGGRLLVDLESSRDGRLPAHRLGPGDIVGLRPSRGETRSASSPSPPTGVVYRVRPERITVALDDFPEDGLPDLVRLDKVAADVTYRRLRRVLERLAGYGRGPASRLREVLFGLREPRFEPTSPLVPFDTGLDESQKEAVAFALAARDIALLHGPPGTGKTTALVELIRQAVRRGERVLACAPSNIGVDNLVERLADAGLRVVRLGHPARLLASVLEHSLDALVAKAEGTQIATNVRREMDALRRRARRARDWAERRELRGHLRRLAAELRETEQRTVNQVLGGAEVVLSTNTGAAEAPVAQLEFDLVVVDEATQALEAATWIPLLRGARAVLAGDHRQLPPTVISPEAQSAGLGVSLFERLNELLGAEARRMLTVQYRMHEHIMNWSSREFYDERLIAHESVREHVLQDLPHVTPRLETRVPVLLIDTAGCDLEEEEEKEGDSRSNSGEAGIVAQHVEALLEAGVKPAEIAVITPYNAQVQRLRSRLAVHVDAGVEVGSVDGFQGREKEAVVISLVRSNPRGEVGFLADERRTNVAVTRARRHVAVVGDSATVASQRFLSRFTEYLSEVGEYRSAWEYL